MLTFSEADARAYVDSVRWQFAKTMAHIPHEYTMLKFHPGREDEFRAFVALMTKLGVVIPWPKPPRKARYHKRYLLLDDWKYWHMDDDPSVTTLVNRAKIEPEDEPYRLATSGTVRHPEPLILEA